MIYVVLIYIIGVVVYNFQPENANGILINFMGHNIPIWRLEINFLRNFTLCYALFYLGMKSVVNWRKLIFISGGAVAGFATLFQCCLLVGAKDLKAYIHLHNSGIWSAVSGVIGFILFICLPIIFWYDKRRS